MSSTLSFNSNNEERASERPLLLRPGCRPECPGCAHRTWTATESEAQKQRFLSKALSLWSDRLHPVRGAPENSRWNYREKTCLHAQWKDGRWVFGLLPPGQRPKKGIPLDVIDLSECPVHSIQIRIITKELSRLLPPSHGFPLVYLLITGTLITLVLKTKSVQNIPEIDWARLGISGVWLNFNPAAGFRVCANSGWKHHWGMQYGIKDGLRYGPDSFQQVFPTLHESALAEAQRFLAPSPGDAVVDLCSGIGRSLRLWKDSGANFKGVELSGDAVANSDWNVGPNASLRGRASERLPQLDAWIALLQPRRLLVYANPPRLGLEDAVVHWLAHKARPQKIAYLSCSPGTLARDLAVLCCEGYSVENLFPYDFFPQTHHVETLALLGRD